MDLGISRAEFKVFQTVNITDFIVILSEPPCLLVSVNGAAPSTCLSIVVILVLRGAHAKTIRVPAHASAGAARAHRSTWSKCLVAFPCPAYCDISRLGAIPLSSAVVIQSSRVSFQLFTSRD